MKNKVLKGVLVAALIITLTLADFVLVGTKLVTYALENGNVKFTAYFKTEKGENVTQTEYEMTNTEMKLYLEVAVENGVNFDGVITLDEGSNFKFQNKLSEGISKIEENKITLETIKKGNTAKIEVAIEPVIEEIYGSDMLSKESVLTLTGNYDDGTEEIQKIDLTSKVTLDLTVPADIDTTLEGKVITNRIYTIGEENKRIVQLNLNSTVVKNAYPIKTTTFTVELPEGVEAIEVISKGTYATNGKADRVLAETTDYTWDKTNKLLQVNIANTSENGKISWKKDATDNIVVTLTLDDETTIGTEEYSVKQKVEFYGQEAKTIEDKEIKYNLTAEADGMIRTSIENKEEIYKGKLYSKEEREYSSTTNIEVNYANLVESAILEESTAYRTETEPDKDKEANILYKTTTITKSEFDKVLGPDGKLTITGNETEEITAESFGENESLTIEYTGEVRGLIIEISNAIETGIIRLNHTKVIKEEYEREEIADIKYLAEKSSVTYGTVRYSLTHKTELKETTSEVALTVTPQTISAEQESKDVQIAITLKTDNEKYELFQAPTFTLTMPEGVTINSVSDGVVSASDGGLVISNLEFNDQREIKIETTGEQLKYITSNINTQITFTANVSVEKLMANKVDTIKMQYTNQGATYEIQSTAINVIASNSKIATHLKVENYDGLGSELERYSDSTSEVKGEIPVNNAEIINVPVKYTIINNFDSAIALTAKVVATLEDNSEETKELTSYSNSEIIIQAGGMQVIEQILEIPAGLYYSEKINIEATAEYTYSGTRYSLPNNILLATEEKEGIRDISVIDNKLKVETFAQLGDGTGIEEDDKIYNEQIIEYVIEVTNVSDEPISNLRITNTQENGNIYDIKSIWVYNYVISNEPIEEHRYAELDTNTKTFEIETLKPGESQELVCGVVVKKTENNSITAANISISADGIEEKSVQRIANNVKDSDLKLTTEKAFNEEVEMYGDSTFHILTHVKNLTNNEMQNLEGRVYLSEGLIFPEDYTFDIYSEDNKELYIIEDIEYDEENNYIDFRITNLGANQEIVIQSNLYIEQIPINETGRNERVYLEINNIVSNAAQINVEQIETEFSVVQTSNVEENTKVKNGEKVIITGEITNMGYIDTSIKIYDEIPLGLELTKVEIIRNRKVTYEAEEFKYNNIIITTEINQNEKIIIKIEAVINTEVMTTEKIINKISAIELNGDYTDSNEITIQVERNIDNSTGMEDDDNQENPDDPGNTDPDDPNNPNPDDPNNPTPDDGTGDNVKTTYTIEGYAWVDKNNNGNKDDNEVIPNVVVKIIDLDNNNTFLKDKDGKEIEVKTNENGAYKIEELPKGNYNVIFKYDTSLYELEENADIKDYMINDTNEKVAITTNIKLEANRNIDLKLVEITEFNLKVDKYITKVIVQTANGTKTTEYVNKQLVKEEIQKKYLSGATVLVEYTIEISNVGELAGYATEIVDYLPSDMKFHSELNTQWYIGEDGNLYNTSLASTAITPGETKTLKLVLVKTMTIENTGITSNNAEISKMINAKEYADIDVTDNQSKAEIIVNTATGTIITYTVALANAVLIIALGLYIIKKKIIGKE